MCICEHSSTSDSQVDSFKGNEAKRNAMLWFPILIIISYELIVYDLTPYFTMFLVNRVMRSCKFRLEKDLRDKFGAHEIDSTCASLTDKHRDLTYSPEAVKIQTK